MIDEISKLRNIGISAHIDAGKTSITERILYYTRRIHAIHEVRGKDGVGATMDSMDLEKERGITIASACTYCSWKDHAINIIDTPGHVDFTIEVERSLRVLDGAILVLCAVAGVQSQSITVDRQMQRYRVPRIAFVNKCDRAGASPSRVIRQLREKLNHNAVAMQIPLGLEKDHMGVIDLVTMKAVTFEGKYGDDVVESEIPDELLEEALEKREEMLDAVSYFSDELTEAILEDRVTEELIYDAVRRGTLDLKLTPVFMGSAYKNKGIQCLLDAVTRYLPSPLDIKNYALDIDQDEKEVELIPDPGRPLVALAFKLEAGRYGQLTYIRIYQGKIEKGDTIVNSRTGQKVKVGRIVRMHADQMEDIEGAEAGDIIGLFGIDCFSGDTFTDGSVNYTLTSIHVPSPVISLSIKPKDSDSKKNLSKALQRFSKEDPTFRTHMDPETKETIISGMGELHLEVYLERMKREYGVRAEAGKPKVAYRETISRRADFDYTHKKQTGGAGQFARVAGFIEPCQDQDFVFESQIKGGVIPAEYIPACEKGFRACLKKGSLLGFPIVGVKVTINDGTTHPVDSSELAFQQAAIGGFRKAYERAKPIVLEPLMRTVVETPREFQGVVLGSLNQRRGIITSTSEDEIFTKIEAEVPLSEMFGYSSVLRSLTQGKAEFTMEFSRYQPLPASKLDDLRKELAEKEKN